MTICLTMIVKDEARVIQRCLDAVIPFIDAWVVVDTGSTDGTQDLVRAALQHLPGELHERPWVNFGHNRTEAFRLAAGRASYRMTIDADEVFEVPPGFTWPELTLDAYTFTHRDGEVIYGRHGLFRDALLWRWEGALHEFPTPGQDYSQGHIDGPVVHGLYDGGRNQRTKEEKYAADALVLERALEDEPDNHRHVFYLAQSYRDGGRPEEALVAYERRAALGGWAEEVWVSLHQVAKLSEQLGRPPEVVIDRYLRAYDFRPSRAEALGDLARYLRQQGRYASAQLFADKGRRLPLSSDILFVDASFYTWRCLDDYAVACSWTGDHAQSIAASMQLLRGGHLPESERARVAANLAFEQRALAGS